MNDSHARHDVFSLRGRLALGNALVAGTIVVEDGTIVEVGRGEYGDAPGPVYEAPIVAPGYIDIQVNGGFGAEVNTSAATYETLAGRLPQRGVTSYLPTLVSAPMSVYGPALDCFSAVAQDPPPGAQALGMHLEGPVLSPARKGAHRQDAIDGADPDAFGELVEACGGVRLVTLAPERPGALDLIGRLRGLDVVVSLGHTDASYDEFTRGIDAGATLATHLYNAMRPMGHREPGPIGAALTDERIAICLIADGHHVDPAAIRLALRARGADSTILVSDMISAAGMPPGPYDLGGQRIHVDGETSRLQDGTLAGVVITLDECVRNVVGWGLATIPDALRMVTENPARLLDERAKGRIVRGYDADLVLLDNALRVQATFISGRRVFGLPAPSAPAR